MLNWRGMWFGARRMMHRHGPIAMITRAGVELSDEQVEKLAEIKGEGFFKFAEQGVGMMPQVREFVRHLSKSEIDKDKVRAIHKEIQAKRNQMGDQFVENIMAIAEVLTPEQRIYPAEGQDVSDTAIRTTGFQDLYLALGDDRLRRRHGDV